MSPPVPPPLSRRPAAALALAAVLAAVGQGLVHHALGALLAEGCAAVLDAGVAATVGWVRVLGAGLLALAVATAAVVLWAAVGRARAAYAQLAADLARADAGRADADGQLAEARRRLAEAEHERAETEAALADAREAAAAADRTKAAILANMSHEVRTPLTGILGYADLLRAEAGGRFEDTIGPIERSARRLLGALDAVLHLARLEAGAEPDGGRASASAEAAEVVARFRPEAEAKGLALTIEAPAAAEIQADRAALACALGSVVENAVRFTVRGGVAVTVREGGGHVEVRVGDTGPGIDPAFMPRLFEAFEQASTGDARTHEGVGLGLAVAGRLVRRMGGTVDVKSRLGRGTAVTFRLPAAPGPAGGDGAAGGVSVPSGHATPRPLAPPAPRGL